MLATSSAPHSSARPGEPCGRGALTVCGRLAFGMGGKHKASKAAKKRAVAQPGGSSSGAGGPSCVLLLRHGQSEANAQRRDMPDPPLTELGRVQAMAWKGAIGRFGAEAVLVSPLRRALETALLAYDRVDVPVEVCRHARELWWDEQANTPSTPEVLEAVLRDLPRGDEAPHALSRSCTPWLPQPQPCPHVRPRARARRNLNLNLAPST